MKDIGGTGAIPAGAIIIDVRTPAEYRAGHLEGAVLLDIHDAFEAKIAALERSRTYLVYCATGGRSRHAVARMRTHGLDARNLVGGIAAWIAAGKPIAGRAPRA